MSRGVDKIKDVLLSPMRILHLYGMALDGDTSFALQIHVVKHLIFRNLNCGRLLQKAVGKSRLSVVDMRNNAEISYMFHSLIILLSCKYSNFFGDSSYLCKKIKKNNMKKLIIACSLVAIVIGLVSCKKQTIDDVAEEQAKGLTENCPFVVGDGIVNDSVTYNRTTRTLSYYFTVAGEIDSAEYMESNKQATHDALASDLRNQIELNRYIEEGISFRYVYHSASEPGVVRYEDTFKF